MNPVLIVDDSMFIRNRMRQVLAGAGYLVEEASNGRAALDKIAGRERGCGFDGIVTDLVMPEMDGFSLLAALRDGGSRIPVLVMTADIQNTTRSRCEELGARYVLNKPVNADQLLETLGRMIAQAVPAP
ncbi:MAG: response regulator [Bryobacteraceae bacterium]